MGTLRRIADSPRGLYMLSAGAFSLLFGYLLAFVFEGPVFYCMAESRGVEPGVYVFTAILSHALGLIGCGFVFTPWLGVRKTMLGGIAAAAAATVLFWLRQSPAVWLVALNVAAFGCGAAVAAWGYYLRLCTPRLQRFKICADVLIFSNLIMIAAECLAAYCRPAAGMGFSLAVIIAAGAAVALLPEQTRAPAALPAAVSLTKPVLCLMTFVVLLTVNSGLMYQVFKPAYRHLEWLSGWYWAIPYVAMLILMRHLLKRGRHTGFLYAGMAMIVSAFVAFMLTGRDWLSYLAVNTLMLGACGIFDLFWWSIIGEMLEYSRRPERIAGVCISANVLGVLLGGVIGRCLGATGLPEANVTVLALVIVCVSTAFLPLLNHSLAQLLKKHAYLYENADWRSAAERPLSNREREVLALLLQAQSNHAIAKILHISEHTVKSHVKSILSKYGVSGRTELVAHLLQDRPLS